jgi:RNA polymerase sigma-70 factor (ECF subfamily)
MMAVTPEKTDPSPDLELTKAAALGDDVARRRVVDRLVDRVSITVRYLAGGDSDADDYAQMAIIEILKSVGSFRGESTLESWADKITVRTAIRQLKRRRRRDRTEEIDSEREGRGTSLEAAPERKLIRHRMSERITKLMETLTPERARVLTMRLVLGYSIEEISSITGMKINTVRDRLAVARRQLRKKIQKDPVLKEFAGSISGQVA